MACSWRPYGMLRVTDLPLTIASILRAGRGGEHMSASLWHSKFIAGGASGAYSGVYNNV